MEVAKKGTALMNYSLSFMSLSFLLSLCGFLRLCFSLHLPPFSIRFDYLILRCPARFLHANGNDCAHAFTQIKTIPGVLLETVGEPVVRPPPPF